MYFQVFNSVYPKHSGEQYRAIGPLGFFFTAEKLWNGLRFSGNNGNKMSRCICDDLYLLLVKWLIFCLGRNPPPEELARASEQSSK